MLSNSGSRYEYYLDNGKIYSNNNGTEVSGLQVDAYFNLTGTYKNKTYNFPRIKTQKREPVLSIK